MITDHWKPREYRFDMDKIGLMLNGTLITAQVDPECGYWIAFFSGYPTEAMRGTSEADAVFELLLTLVYDFSEGLRWRERGNTDNHTDCI